ncbi:hypothetical protein [Sedimentibacter sp.]|uniref:hypothetical protein n=1 Tax=Sedimentibacter sp. TaxID=1960295 RepID=UPI000EC35531|nr:hypothetical protein [Sedimentibacter sp.]HCX61559.1 hypothetical protein [Clostridiales bacterium]
MKIIQVLKNEFRDSLFLLKMSNDISNWEGVKQAVVVMATQNNCKILEQVGLMEGDAVEAAADDLIIAIEVEPHVKEAEILERLKGRLNKDDNKKSWESTTYTLEAALEKKPESNMVVISTPGKYAADMARESLEAGKHVFCFSQHVSVADEIELKKLAISKNLLMMGPDCGTSIIDGYGLGFANKVRKGCIGLISASGSGLQEVTTLIHKSGGGIAQAIGVGGRDLSSPMDGMMAEAAISLLIKDPQVKVLVILAKKASAIAQKRILQIVEKSKLPLVADFGLAEELVDNKKKGVVIVNNYEECAREAIKLAGLKWNIGTTHKEFIKWLGETNISNKKAKVVRGLYAGGSLCGEAVSIFQRSNLNLASNLSGPLESYLESEHVFLDLGAEEYTEGRAHPFIDYRIRVLELNKAFANQNVAVVVMDVVIGWGSNEDPASELVKGIRIARQKYGHGPILIASVVGTEDDFQQIEKQKTKLREADVFIAESNAMAVTYALEIINQRRGEM